MSKINTIKVAGARVAKGYATYKSAQRTTRELRETVSRRVEFDADYGRAEWQAASRIARDHMRPSRFGPKVSRAHDRMNSVREFQESQWTTLSIPGASVALQARVTAYEVIEFRSPLPRDLRVVRDLVATVAAEMQEEVPVFEVDDFNPSTSILGWKGKDGWELRTERPSRSFRSVFLPKELQEEIEHDIEQFTKSRSRLSRLELPWRRGYLLSGPPGTGKTSLSLAVAGALGFRVATLSLTEIKSDGELREAVSKLPSNTVLVIEDIDAYAVSRERSHSSAKDGDLSLSGLLNSLDGFETPSGLVTIATTNHVEHLDSALKRSGRLDRIFTLDYIEAKEVERLFAWFYEQQAPGEAPAETGKAFIAPADVMELFKQHLNDPEGGWNALLQRVESATNHAAIRSLRAA